MYYLTPLIEFCLTGDCHKGWKVAEKKEEKLKKERG